MKIQDTKKQPILILTSHAGGGHISLAKAITDLIKTHHKHEKVIVHSTSIKIVELLYRYIGNQFSETVATYWEWSNDPQKIEVLTHLYTLTTLNSLERIIKKTKPKIIISTEPITIQAVQQVLKKNSLSIPHFVYIADPFTIHQLWMSGKTEVIYLSPTKEATQFLLSQLGGGTTIITTGFLVRPQYYEVQRSVTNKLYTILVGGSGEGGGDILKIIKVICKDEWLQKKVKLVIACGKNQLIKKKLEIAPYLQKIRHKIIGYTPKLHEYLAKADLIVGKPGPNILFESIMYGKPFIATGNPLAQEVGNYLFIDNAGVGYSTTNAKITAAKIKLFMKSDQKQILHNINRIKKIHRDAPAKIMNALTPYL